MDINELRKYRLYGIALFDLILGFVGMIIIFLIAWKWHFPDKNPLYFIIAAILLTIPMGIFFHVIFGVNTTLNSKLRLS